MLFLMLLFRLFLTVFALMQPITTESACVRLNFSSNMSRRTAVELPLLLLTLCVLVLVPPQASWCNAHTCDERCKSCAVCAAVANGTHCEAWCNSHTCGDPAHRCAGCTLCQPDSSSSRSSTYGAPAKSAGKVLASPGWGCCADRQATSCDACRFWTAPDFCSRHGVNCGTCGFSLYCHDPATTPPPTPPAPPPATAVDLQCRHGRLYDCTGSAGAQFGDCAAEFMFKGVSWFGMEEAYALPQGLLFASSMPPPCSRRPLPAGTQCHRASSGPR